MPREDLILWIDLETTGNTDADEIIEVGLVLTTHDLQVISQFTSLIEVSQAGLEHIASTPVVSQMHKTSGLLDDFTHATSVPTAAQCDESIIEWLDSNAGNSTEHIPFAGSGVMHFDRQYIRRFLPRLDKRITFWAYDVGVLRRTWRLCGIPTHTPSKSLKTHRALDDTYAALAEYIHYTGQLRKSIGEDSTNG